MNNTDFEREVQTLLNSRRRNDSNEFQNFSTKAEEYNAAKQNFTEKKDEMEVAKTSQMDLKEQITRAVNNRQVGIIERLVGEYGDAYSDFLRKINAFTDAAGEKVIKRAELEEALHSYQRILQGQTTLQGGVRKRKRKNKGTKKHVKSSRRKNKKNLKSKKSSKV